MRLGPPPANRNESNYVSIVYGLPVLTVKASGLVACRFKQTHHCVSDAVLCDANARPRYGAMFLFETFANNHFNSQ